MTYILKTNNLSKQFKETLALNEVNMTINKGDIYGFVGENGAGKSTFFKTITSIIKETSGSYNLNIENRKGSLAAIIENPAIHESLNAIGNLNFQNDLLNLKKTRKEIEDLLTLVGLDDVINSKKKARNFSLGMKQRLSIAIVLLSDPEFILLDEPMNGLDPLGIKHIRDLILKLNEEKNITFLISSHMLTELDKVATKYGFISKGVLVKEIGAKELRELTKLKTQITFVDKIDENLLAQIENYNFKKIDSYTLEFEEVNDQKILIKHLSKSDNSIVNIQQIKNDLESYYVEVIGGRDNV